MNHKIRFQTVSGSTYVIDLGEGVVHRTNAKQLRDVDGGIIAGSAWKLDHVVGLITPMGFLAVTDDAKIGSLLPQGAMLPVVGHDKPIVTTPITDLQVLD